MGPSDNAIFKQLEHGVTEGDVAFLDAGRLGIRHQQRKVALGSARAPLSRQATRRLRSPSLAPPEALGSR